MVQKQRPPEKLKPIKAAVSAPKAETPTASAKEVAAPVPAIEAVSQPAVVTTALATVVFPPRGEAADDATIEFNLGELPLRTLDYFAENAFAYLEHASELGKAASLAEAIELQSNFAKDRYSAFLKQIDSTSEILNYLAKGAGFSIRQSFGSFAA